MGYGTKIGYIRQASVRNERVSFTVRVAFLKKMCEWAVSKMRVSDDSSSAASTGKTRKLEAMKKDEVEELFEEIRYQTGEGCRIRLRVRGQHGEGGLLQELDCRRITSCVVRQGLY